MDTLNSFMETVYQALNKNITYNENIACFIKEITYTTPSTYPTGVPITEFVSTLKTKASAVELLQCYEKSTYTPAVGPVYVPWIDNNGTITISTITGLAANKTYIIRLRIS